MDLAKILELAEQANEFINTMKNTTNNYIDTINGYLCDIEVLINSAGVNSAKYIQTKTQAIYDDINETLIAFKQKIDGLISNLKSWYDEQINNIKINIVKAQQAKLGLSISNDVAEKLAAAIPHPQLAIPDFKINIPEFSINTNVSVSIPRIPNI